MFFPITPSPTAPGQWTFDGGSMPDAELLKRVFDLLRTEPSVDHVAREIVMHFLAPFHARASVISVIENNATLHVAGSFGVPNCDLHPGYCSIWDDFPSAAAVRLRQPVVVECPEECARLFPVVHEIGLPTYTVASVPLFTSASTVGAISVYLAAEGPTVRAAAEVVQAIADVYVLVLGATLVNSPQAIVHDAARCCAPPTAIAGRPAIGSVVEADLTERQRRVLELLSERMTYDQIASRIGYSHSTVREELMHVYRLLGVHSRREAVNEAIRRGILSAAENVPAPS